MQCRVLEGLEEGYRQGRPPLLSELAQQLGIHYVTLREHLGELARKGYVRVESRGRGKSPLVTLLKPHGVPLVGHIAAGPLGEALEHPEGYLRLPGYPGRFGLRVTGESMADLIQHGDVVILRKGEPRSGDICAVRVDGSEVTLKYLEVSPAQSDRVLLRPHNPDYPPLEVEAERVLIDGIFSALLRGDVIDVLFHTESVMN